MSLDNLLRVALALGETELDLGYLQEAEKVSGLPGRKS